MIVTESSEALIAKPAAQALQVSAVGTRRNTRDIIDLPRVAVTAIGAVLALLFAVRLLAAYVVPFTDSTEARYAEIARKMVETNNWITPQFNYGIPFLGQAPSAYVALSWWDGAFGINEFAARLPILVVTLIVLALIWTWVANVTGRNAALLSVAVLSSMGLFFGVSAFVMTDMPMTLGTTLVMVGFWYAVCQDTPNRAGFWAIPLGLAIGLLAKGPVSSFLCLIPTLGWLIIMGKWSDLRALPWLKGAALFLALTVPWYAAAEIATPGFLRYFLVGEHMERFIVPGWSGDLYGIGHSQPKGIIWLFALGTILPWSVLLVPIYLRTARVAQVFKTDKSGWIIYLLLWSVAPLILFSPAASILPAYALPGLPAAAVLMVVLYCKAWAGAPGFLHKFAFVVGSGVSILTFAIIAILAVSSPDTLNLRSQKQLIIAAQRIAPDAPIYIVGGRSHSAEFYTDGQVKYFALDALPALVDTQERTLLSVPLDLAAQVATLNVRRLGEYSNHVLFIRPAGSR